MRRVGPGLTLMMRSTVLAVLAVMMTVASAVEQLDLLPFGGRWLFVPRMLWRLMEHLLLRQLPLSSWLPAATAATDEPRSDFTSTRPSALISTDARASP